MPVVMDLLITYIFHISFMHLKACKGYLITTLFVIFAVFLLIFETIVRRAKLGTFGIFLFLTLR